jgi:hypothetical protein
MVMEWAMKYVFLVYQEKPAAVMEDSCRLRAIAGEAREYQEHLRQQGHLLSSSTLAPDCSALAVRAHLSGVSFVDAPFAETNEQLAEICLVKARDLNEAIRLAGQMPQARLGRIEVWALQEEERKPRDFWASGRQAIED